MHDSALPEHLMHVREPEFPLPATPLWRFTVESLCSMEDKIRSRTYAF